MKTDREKVYKHDWSGHCDGRLGMATFSVGIFQWIPKVKKGLKKTAVKYRVRGYASNPQKVYQRAEEVCDYLDSGNVLDKKSEMVK